MTESERKKAAERSASAVVMTLDNVAGAVFGDDCRMKRAEQVAITEPLIEILREMTPEQQVVLEKYTNPLALLLGLAAWGSRIRRTLQERAKAEDKAEQQPTGAVDYAGDDGRPPETRAVTPEEMSRLVGGAPGGTVP